MNRRRGQDEVSDSPGRYGKEPSFKEENAGTDVMAKRSERENFETPQT